MSQPAETNPVLSATVVGDVGVDIEAAHRLGTDQRQTKPYESSSPHRGALSFCIPFVCGVLLGGLGIMVSLQAAGMCAAIGAQSAQEQATCATMSDCMHGTCVMLEGAPTW